MQTRQLETQSLHIFLRQRNFTNLMWMQLTRVCVCVCLCVRLLISSCSTPLIRSRERGGQLSVTANMSTQTMPVCFASGFTLGLLSWDFNYWSELLISNRIPTVRELSGIWGYMLVTMETHPLASVHSQIIMFGLDTHPQLITEGMYFCDCVRILVLM